MQVISEIFRAYWIYIGSLAIVKTKVWTSRPFSILSFLFINLLLVLFFFVCTRSSFFEIRKKRLSFLWGIKICNDRDTIFINVFPYAYICVSSICFYILATLFNGYFWICLFYFLKFAQTQHFEWNCLLFHGLLVRMLILFLLLHLICLNFYRRCRDLFTFGLLLMIKIYFNLDWTFYFNLWFYSFSCIFVRISFRIRISFGFLFLW